MKKTLNVLLFISFIITIMVPFTGIVIHKLAATLFLICCVIHTIVRRKKLGRKKYILLFIVFIAFLSGIFGMILEEIPIMIAMHKVISVVCIFCLAVHIFIYHKKI